MHPVPPRRIRPLSPLLANQIAAGEVVERPASVVKELVENSLDAGAERIEIEIEQAGLRLIRITDDGWGIHPDDLPLSVSRHATSKVYDLEEMSRVVSMGFRGEALASIASVSRFRLISRHRDGDAAWALSGEGGEFASPQPAAHAPGTSIEVRDLFFNAPARRKFLRTERTEFAYLEDTVRRLALGRFGVGLILRHNGRTVFSTPAGEGERQRLRRLATLCGQPFLDNARGVDLEAGGLRLHGWVGQMDYSRSQADLQYFFVNGRTIRDRLVTHALRQAYRESLPPGRHPAYVLFLEIAPERVDVNVHPTKHEVRFREARLVHDFLFHALREALSGAVAGRGEPLAAALPERERLAEARPAYGPAAEADGAAQGWECAASLPGGYLLGRNAGEMVLVDRLRAERFLLRRRLRATRPVASRPLLIPARVTLSAGEAAQLEGVRERLKGYGLEVDRTGESSLVVRRIPTLLEGVEVAALVRELLGLLSRGGEEREVVERLAECGAQARAAGRVSGEENALLLRTLYAARAEAQAEGVWVAVGEAQWRALFGRLSGEKLS